VQAGKAPPIPVETRAADQASQPLSDVKTGGKVRGRTMLSHQKDAHKQPIETGTSPQLGRL